MNQLLILFNAANTHRVLALMMLCAAGAAAVSAVLWLGRAWQALHFGGGFWHYDKQAKKNRTTNQVEVEEAVA
jgi:hypothetical protein